MTKFMTWRVCLIRNYAKIGLILIFFVIIFAYLIVLLFKKWAVFLLHKMRVNEVSFNRIEEVHDCQNVTAIFESFQIMCYSRKNELIEIQLYFISTLLSCWITFLESWSDEFLIVQNVKIDFNQTLSLGKLWILFCFETVLKLIHSLMSDRISLIS